MRFMIIVRGAPDSGIAARIAEFHARLETAGALLDAAAPLPGAPCWRRRLDSGSEAVATPTVAGYALIQARTVEAALEWLHRYPGVAPAEIEMFRLR